MNVAIVGSRNFHNNNLFLEYINSWRGIHGQIGMIISGGATGVDTLAANYARLNGIQLVEFLPRYDLYPGKRAPLERNTEIVDFIHVNGGCIIAFPTDDSRGTYDTINKALKLSIPVFIFKV